MERDNLFDGQVREEGLEEPELPAAELSALLPVPPALASHLGKVKISRKRLQIGLTPPPSPLIKFIIGRALILLNPPRGGMGQD